MKSNFGLPEDVKFCNECVISNQRPVTLVETKHSIKEKKNQRILMKMEFVMLVIGLK